ncbi:erythromycin esterase family protein [Flavobacteriaceae bacterium XHP0103]|uniref:erythromycin esterase family protein n=1 Tax=Marixanthotalea marina TaxID=2844359 RepID=UPI002989E7DC|nr:erythromycin esterase family protein [Marixanthotalea marina]MBU3823165.1 erythromycin esterase family protein [Marixanthotalea marina]
MKKTLPIFIFILSFLVNSQNKETIDWITNNSIEIEDASPDSELVFFEQNTPNKFNNAKIYGFGEASHNTKEFFDLKAKFFKHLVKTQGVKTFIMEESYQAESGINEWISGGKGDINTIGKNFRNGFWYCNEIVNLLQWMRDYNLEKPKEEQIRFYGMDVNFGTKTNQEIRDFVNKYKLTVNEKLLMVADSCSNKKINYGKTDNWAKTQVPKLKELEQALINSQTDTKINQKDLKSVIRSLNYLMKYTQYVSNTVGAKESNEFRDLKMFENVKWIIENESENEKAFIWAHNEHINKKEMNYSGSGIINLGRLLKDYYKKDYYSVGFDFGTGYIKGYTINKKQGNHWKTYHIEKPFKKTYAQTLMNIDKDIYFVDLDNAIKNEPTKFFSKKSKHLLISGGGYQPEPLHRIMVSKIYAETYDGLIFVKKISLPDYLNK